MRDEVQRTGAAGRWPFDFELSCPHDASIRRAYNVVMATLHFEWDPVKAAVNLRKHKVSFEDARTEQFAALAGGSPLLSLGGQCHPHHFREESDG